MPRGKSSHIGEIIAAPFHTYNSIGNVAPIVQQDDLSLSIASVAQIPTAKLFVSKEKSGKARNLICFLENTPSQAGKQDNLSMLFNQDDFISSILTPLHLKGKLVGTSLDFTVRNFRYLYLLYAKSIVVLDFSGLLHSQRSGELQIQESIQISGGVSSINQFTRIEVASNEGEGLLLFRDTSAQG